MSCKRAEQPLKTCEPSCVPGADRPFFIPMVHSPPGAVGHVAALELPSQEGRARSHGTHSSTGAHLVKEARFRAEGHVAAPELTSVRRRGPSPRDTWWHRSLPLQGGAVRSYSLRGSEWMHALLVFRIPTMPIEISSYKEFLRDGHATNQCVQLLLQLHLNTLIETYLRGVSTNNIKN
jgi:hypothetical protein